MQEFMIIDGQKVELKGEKNILEVIRKAGIDLPTFCYHSELSIYGACRMCIVEDKWGGVITSCSTPPKAGMEIYTNTPKLQRHRKMIIELILADHDRDCTVCEKNGKCKLQELAIKLGIKKVRFNETSEVFPLDESSKSIIRNPNKCINCGDCVRMCEEVQGVGILAFAHRGSKIKVTTAFDKPLAEVDCVNCGQCASVCPTGALIIKDETSDVWKAIFDKNKRVVAQIAPAVRIALGEEFGLNPGEIVTGKIAAALRKLGFDEVYDTAFSADLTVIEESKEFMARLSKGENLPLFTSCCPAWVKHVEDRYPELRKNVSSCLSPQQMFGSVVKEYYGDLKEDTRETIIVSVMPCTAKKFEANREEFKINGKPTVDIVITTQELASMIKEAGIVFNEIERESMDMPFGFASGSGIIFGVTGGVAEAVLRHSLKENKSKNLKELTFVGVRGMDGIKEATVEIDGKNINIAVVHGLKNAQDLIKKIKNGEKAYHFVEVMACPGGCIGGGGQPNHCSSALKKLRSSGLYNVDNITHIKRSEENPMIKSLYDGILKDNTEILHNTLAHD